MAEEGTWTKIKRSVKGFFTGAIKAAPMSLVYSGAAFGISAALGHVNPEMDFLNVGKSDGARIATRLMGSMVIGSGVSGIFKAFESYNTPVSTVASAVTGGNSTSKTTGKGLSQQYSMGGLSSPITPNNQDNKLLIG